MTVPVEIYLGGSYAEEVTEEEGPAGKKLYVARYKRMPGCLAQGSTRTEALVALRKTREPYIRELHKAGARLPLPDFDGHMPVVFIGEVAITTGEEGPVTEPVEESSAPKPTVLDEELSSEGFRLQKV